MDPFTCVLILVATNLVLKKHVVPAVRLHRGRVLPHPCGVLGVLGLTAQELRDLQAHPTIRKGRMTQAAYEKAAGR
jgi:hypothetical protein